MIVRLATSADAAAIHGIYAPFVRDTVISFEFIEPGVEEIATRIEAGSATHPWLVAADPASDVVGYAYAASHRTRVAYRWAAEVSAYVSAPHRHRGVGSRLYGVLLSLLEDLGYRRALAGIALPNPPSVAFHESMGFVHVGTYHDIGFKLGAWRDVGWWERAVGAPCEGEPPPPPTRADERESSDVWRRILGDHT